MRAANRAFPVEVTRAWPFRGRSYPIRESMLDNDWRPHDETLGDASQDPQRLWCSFPCLDLNVAYRRIYI